MHNLALGALGGFGLYFVYWVWNGMLGEMLAPLSTYGSTWFENFVFWMIFFVALGIVIGALLRDPDQ
jgi:hypothetical protein